MDQKTMAPTDFEQLVTVVRYEIFRYIRRRRLWAMLAIVFLIFFLILLVPPAYGVDYPPEFGMYSQIYLSFTWILILLCATFFGSDALVSEFQHKTGFVIFPNPVKRSTIALGKFSASMIASILVICIYYGLIALFVGGIYKAIDVEFAYSFLLALLYLSSAMGVAYLISSVMKGTMGSTVLTFFLFFLILPMIGQILSFVGVKPWFFITFAGDTISYIGNVPYPQDGSFEVTMSGQTMTIHEFYPDVWVSVAVMVGYLVVCLILAVLRFNRRE
ncbi:MAG: ABC transporter permease, partial [Candidatus Thermoplasmatota archaeon]|nr:ABC transporter permease [Candidatus Thermoplasmatota archaeon]